MTRSEIFREIKNLPPGEQLLVLETVARHLRQQIKPDAESAARGSDLAQAAKALLSDYQSDAELTAFTSLDQEDFHETR